jgi:hypothetical protein
MPEKSNSSVSEFLKAFTHQAVAVIGAVGISVPSTYLAVYADKKYEQIIYGALAFLGFLIAPYRVWKAEREQVSKLSEKVSTLEERLRPKIDLKFDRSDTNCLHLHVDGGIHAHLFVYNHGEFGIPDCEVILQEVRMADEHDVYRRVEKYRTAVALGWSRVVKDLARKYGPYPLPCGRNLVDLVWSKPQLNSPEGPCFLVNVNPEHGPFMFFGKVGKYLLTVQASAPQTSSNTMRLLVEWNGKADEMDVTDVTAQPLKLG